MPELKINYQRASFEALSPEDQSLIQEARNARDRAHAPYSNFHVGCSLIDITGKITSGNNQENAAYPSGLCAERVALFNAKSVSKEAIDAMVVVAIDARGKHADAFCCGGCRQVMMEYASLQKKPIRLLMGTKENDFIVLEDTRALMPFGFDLKNLG